MPTRAELNRLIELLTRDTFGYWPNASDRELVEKFERLQRTGRWGNWWDV